MAKSDIMAGIEGVICDLDGTLVDSMWLWKDVDIEYLGRFGYSLPEGLQREIEGMSFRETAHYIRERFQIPDSEERMMEDWNRMGRDKYLHEVPLKEGVQEFLDACLRHGVRLGIATSNSSELVRDVLGVHHLENYFSAVVTGTEVSRGKPSPDIYLTAAKRLGVAPEHCLVFEDIVPGILAGKRAGMRTCAVGDPYSLPQEEEKRREADDYIGSFLELRDVFDR